MSLIVNELTTDAVGSSICAIGNKAVEWGNEIGAIL